MRPRERLEPEALASARVGRGRDERQASLGDAAG